MTRYRQIRTLYGHLDNIYSTDEIFILKKKEIHSTGDHVSYLIRFYIIR
jgi:hypothetical protein